MTQGSTLDYLPADEARGPSWLRRLAALFAFYPVLLLGLLYATWLTAWAMLGHPPRPSIDDPASISALVDLPRFAFGVLLVTAFPVLGVHLGLVLVSLFDRTVAGWRLNRRGVAVMLIATGLWATAFALLRLDPGGVVFWYMD